MINVFVIGSPKCGSTFLYSYLRKDARISLSTTKELNYWSKEELLRDQSYYQDTKIDSLDVYHAMFDLKKVNIDFSVSYMRYPSVIEKILSYNPDAKFVILRRDPVKRAVSHYEMDRRLGHVSGSLHDVLQDRSSFPYQQYIANSAFDYFIDMYKERLDEALLVIDDIYSEDSIKIFYNFLGLDHKDYVIERVNEGYSFRFKLPTYVIRLIRNLGIHTLFKAKWLKRVVTVPVNPVDQTTKTLLKEHINSYETD